MLEFCVKGKNYDGVGALEIVRQIESDALNYPFKGGSIRLFLFWSLDHLDEIIAPREIYLSDQLEDETLALSYLYLCDEYGAG